MCKVVTSQICPKNYFPCLDLYIYLNATDKYHQRYKLKKYKVTLVFGGIEHLDPNLDKLYHVVMAVPIRKRKLLYGPYLPVPRPI